MLNIYPLNDIIHVALVKSNVFNSLSSFMELIPSEIILFTFYTLFISVLDLYFIKHLIKKTILILNRPKNSKYTNAKSQNNNLILNRRN